MRRRELLVLLGSVAVVGSAAVLSPHFWQRARDDQRRSNVYRIGLLSAAAPIADNSPFGAPLMRGLSRRGYELGRNLVFAGATPQEIDPDGKASDELNRLFEFVCDIVNNRRSEHVQGSHEGAPAGA
jgi:hypothetical protein